MENMDRLDILQKHAIRIIYQKQNTGLTLPKLMNMYGLKFLKQRLDEHHLVLMYRLSRDSKYIHAQRPSMVLRNDKKQKFNLKTTKLTKILKAHLIMEYVLGNNCQRIFNVQLQK